MGLLEFTHKILYYPFKIVSFNKDKKPPNSNTNMVTNKECSAFILYAPLYIDQLIY